MAILPVTLRRRLRSSGFSEEQADALDEASEATADVAREGLARKGDVNEEFSALRAEMRALRAEMQALRADMNVLVWRVFGSLAALILAATAALIAAIAVWG